MFSCQQDAPGPLKVRQSQAQPAFSGIFRILRDRDPLEIAYAHGRETVRIEKRASKAKKLRINAS
jgi:hypothetical protein